MQLTDKRFCVYVYKDSDGVHRYVGQGTHRRIKSVDRIEPLKSMIMSGEVTAEILHDGLTKEEAIEVENDYLDSYLGKNVDGWNLLNKTGRQKVRVYEYEYFNEFLFLDDTSPSGLRWKVERRSGNKLLKIQKRVGDLAGSLDASGYYVVVLNKEKLQAHRVVWVLHNKKDLDHTLVVNHKDMVKSNNKPSNLEAVSPRDNNLNFPIRKDNTSGIVGVRWEEENKVWKATMRVKGEDLYKRFYVKHHESERNALEAAIAYRKELERLYTA